MMMKLFLSLALFFIVLAPNFRNLPVSLSSIFAILVLSLALPYLFQIKFRRIFFLIFISLNIYILFMSFINDKFDVTFIVYLIKIVVYIGIGISIGYLLKNRTIDLSRFMISALFLIIVTNSFIVLFEFVSPEFRQKIESLMTISSRVDYAAGLRYRGLATAGGANLSVLHGLAPLSLSLFEKSKKGYFMYWFSMVVVFMSLIFIGRSGLFVFILCFLVVFSKRLVQLKAFITLSIGLMVLMSILALYYDYITTNELLPSHYQNYALKTVFGGYSALEQDGTIAYVSHFYNFDAPLLKILFGSGDFSGGFRHGYQYPGDPGIMKLITQFGIIGSLYIYIFILLYTYKLNDFTQIPLLTLFLILLLLETKEPLLWKGYAARYFWICLGVAIFTFQAKPQDISGIRLNRSI